MEKKSSTQALLIDLDGTLIDSAADIHLAVRDAMAEVGVAEPEPRQVRNWIGNGTAVLVKRALTGEMDGEPPGGQFRRAKCRFDRAYTDHLGRASALFPKVFETLRVLHTQGLSLACITNKPEAYTLPLLKQFAIGHLFKVVVAGDLLPHNKPSPEPLYYAAERCGVAIGRCLMVGDSRHDVRAARAAGCAVVTVSYGYNHGEDIREAGADQTIDHFDQLLELL